MFKTILFFWPRCLLLLPPLLLPVLLHAQDDQDGRIYLIAHRGGVVHENLAENSRAAAEEAIDRGYWMLEVDLRETLDGKIIVHHDATFERYYGESGRVSEKTWNEIRNLKSNVDGSRPMLFKEFVELTRGRIHLMLDVKADQPSAGFHEELERLLKNSDMLSSTFILNGEETKSWFSTSTSQAVNLEGLLAAYERGENVGERYHLFELGSRIDEETVRTAASLGVIVVAAINEFRYVMAGLDTWEGARQDVARLRRLGVTYFQIDSMYEPLFR